MAESILPIRSVGRYEHLFILLHQLDASLVLNHSPRDRRVNLGDEDGHVNLTLSTWGYLYS
jgi:hypothetical protein